MKFKLTPTSYAELLISLDSICINSWKFTEQNLSENSSKFLNNLMNRNKESQVKLPSFKLLL